MTPKLDHNRIYMHPAVVHEFYIHAFSATIFVELLWVCVRAVGVATLILANSQSVNPISNPINPLNPIPNLEPWTSTRFFGFKIPF